MALDERSRHELYQRLEEALGSEAATTLMEHLPPAGWADVAMKRDVDALEVALRRDLDRLEQRMEVRFEGLEERMHLRFDSTKFELLAAFRGELQAALTAQGRQLAITLAGTAGALSALAFAAARMT